MKTTTPVGSPLRQRMIEDMRLRKLSEKTQGQYIRAVRRLAAYLKRSPDTATVEDLRNFQLYLVDHGISPMTLNIIHYFGTGPLLRWRPLRSRRSGGLSAWFRHCESPDFPGRPGGGQFMSLRIMLVDHDPGRSAILEQALTDAGHQVIARIDVGSNLLREVQAHQPDMVIIDMASPGRDTLEQMREISRDQPKPIVLFSDKRDGEYIRQAVQAGVSAYVVDGLSRERVMPIVDVAIARFREFDALRRELRETKNQLADRKVIDKAKGVLMQRKGLSEDAAYQLLRKAAMDRNMRVADVARTLLAIEDL